MLGAPQIIFVLSTVAASDSHLTDESRVGPKEKSAATFTVYEDFVRPEDGDWEVSKDDRAVVAELVRDAHLPRLSLVASRLEAIGAENLRIDALSNTITATISADAIARSLDIADIVSVSEVSFDVPEQSGTYHGLDIRLATLADKFIDNASHYNGDLGSRTNESLPIAIGIIEAPPASGPPNRLHSHVGYDEDASHVISRVKATKVCSTTVCSADPFASVAGQTHGDAVTSSAAGSIEEFQDTTYLVAADQKARSGTSSESDLYYYISSFNGSIPVALTSAFDDGVDIANLSLGTGAAQRCDRSADIAGLNATIDLVSALGMLVVAAAGNNGFSGACNIDYPALRPKVLAVGALNTTQASAGIPPYPSTALLGETSKGGMNVIVNGTTRTISAVGLVAPGARILTYVTPVGSTGYNSGIYYGTSIAAPITAATVADFIQMMVASGEPNPHSPQTVRSWIYLYADRFNGSGGLNSTTTSDLSGFGRLKVYLPASTSFGANYDHAAGSIVLSAAGTQDIIVSSTALPTSAVQAKAVAVWDELGTLSDVADIKISLVKSCPGAEVLLSTDSSYNITKRVTASSVASACLKLRLTANYLPASRRVYFAWIWHSGAQLL